MYVMNEKQSDHKSGRGIPVKLPEGYPQGKDYHNCGLHDDPCNPIADHGAPMLNGIAAIGRFFEKKIYAGANTDYDPAENKNVVFFHEWCLF